MYKSSCLKVNVTQPVENVIELNDSGHNTFKSLVPQSLDICINIESKISKVLLNLLGVQLFLGIFFHPPPPSSPFKKNLLFLVCH